MDEKETNQWYDNGQPDEIDESQNIAPPSDYGVSITVAQALKRPHAKRHYRAHTHVIAGITDWRMVLTRKTKRRIIYAQQ
ncbi:hypothetical protein QJS04_geneDACA006212 [Acorus gramineus]|uniref:Uncharacterized protein n=1 Tax=Acorus gramineus TaxID=55184 RepID=A0AAV9AU34_ACOGR|nr:hypothetical protein QJS04_geneDACA006212 [Acorus gramineus]